MPTCGLQSAESNRGSLKYQVEDPACYGKLRTAGTRITKVFKSTNPDPSVTKETKVSEVIRDDRQIDGTYALNATSAVKADYEFARGTIDDFIAGYVGRELWTKDMTMHYSRGTALAITANNTITIQNKDLTPLIAIGDKVKTEGFITPANNNYFTVSTIAFAAGVTTITTVELTMVIEAGNKAAAAMDANDILLSGTTLQTNATGFNAGGAGVFAPLIAAGTLQPGRIIYAQGLGLEESTVTLSGLPVNGETLTIADGTEKTVTFEFVTLAGTATLGNTEVLIGAAFANTGANLQVAIMTALNEKRLDCSASFVAGTGVLTIRNLNRLGAGAVTGTVTNAVIVAFAGGDSTVNGYFTIQSVTATQLNVLPAPTVNTNVAAKFVVLKGSHVAPPSKAADIQKISYQMEQGHEDVGQFRLYRGQRVEGIDMDISANGLINGAVNFAGSKVTPHQAPVLGTAPFVQYEAITAPVYNATLNVKEFKRNGVTMPVTVMSMKLNLKTDLRKQFGVGSYWNVGIGQGRLDVTASMEMYFQDNTIYNDFIDNTEFSMEMVLEDTDRWSYVITLPRLFPSDDKMPMGAIDTDVMETIEVTANVDTGLSGSTIIFNRFSSLLPTTA